MENGYIKMYILFQSWRLLATQDSEESKKLHYNGGILEKNMNILFVYSYLKEVEEHQLFDGEYVMALIAKQFSFYPHFPEYITEGGSKLTKKYEISATELIPKNHRQREREN